MNIGEGYKLYALKVNEPNIEKMANERFCRICPKYILLYTKSARPENCVEVEGQNLKRLSGNDREWLKDCLMVLLAEKIEKEAPKIREKVSEQIAELEKALEKEAVKQKGESDG